MMNRKTWVALAGFKAMTAGAVLAAMPNEDPYLSELPVVLTASRLVQSALDAPVPVTVIDRDTIRASGFTEIHDLFRLVPGFLVADWAKGSPVVVNHGLGDSRSRRMQVLIDGRSAYEPFFGGINWQDMPIRIEDIERVEVVRAPNQASYGANAFMGVINIITRSPVEDHGLGVALSRGRLDFEDNYLRVGGQSGAVDWRVSASKRGVTNFRDKGYSVLSPIPQSAGWTEAYWWDESLARETLDGQVVYQLASDQELRAHVGISQGEDRVGSNRMPDYYDDPHHTKSNRNVFVQLGWRKTYGAQSELSVQYFHLENALDERYAVVGTSVTVPVDKGIDIQRDDLELQQTHVFSPGLKGVWGLGVRSDQASSEHYLYGLGKVGGTQWQLFGNLDWQAAPDWLLHAGGMLEKHYATDTLFSPRLALNYAIGPSHAIRVGIGRAYRAPTIYETSAHEAFPYAGGVADIGMWSYQELDPESVEYLDIGYVGHLPRLGLNLDARLFWEKYKNFIDDEACPPETGGCEAGLELPVGYGRPDGFPFSRHQFKFGHPKAYFFRNSDEVRIYGGDISIDWKSEALGRVLLTHAITEISAQGEVDRDWESSAPQRTTSLLWSRDLPWRTRISVGYYRVGYMMWPNNGDHQPDYERVDVRLAKQFGKKGTEDEIALTLQNLNGSHQEFDYYSVERQAFITLRLGW